MSSIAGFRNYNHSIPLLALLCLVPTGTLVRVKVDDNTDMYYMHKVTTADNALEFIMKLYAKYKRLLYVYEITVFKGEYCSGISAKCIMEVKNAD